MDSAGTTRGRSGLSQPEEMAPIVDPRVIVGRMRAAAAADPAVVGLRGQTVVRRVTLLKTLMTAVRGDPHYKVLHLGTFGSGSLDRRVKELVIAWPGPIPNPWSGGEFSAQVLGLAATSDLYLDPQDPLYLEYIDLFWAVALPYEWVRAQALQRFLEVCVPRGMRHGLRQTIRDNYLKNDEGPDLRRWALNHLLQESDVFRSLAIVPDYGALDAVFATRIQESLSNLRDSMLFRDQDLDSVGERLASVAAPRVSTRVRPELVEELAEYMDGPAVPVAEHSARVEIGDGDSAPITEQNAEGEARPLNEWRERFVSAARSALRRRRPGLAGLDEYAEDAWSAAVTRVLEASGSTGDGEGAPSQPLVTYASLVSDKRLGRALDEVVPRRVEHAVGSLGDEPPRRSLWDSISGADVPGGSEREQRPSHGTTWLAIVDDLEMDGTANSIVLWELVLTLDQFAASVVSRDPLSWDEQLRRRVTTVARKLRDQGRIRGRVNVDAVYALLNEEYHRALSGLAESAPATEQPDEPVVTQCVEYACDHGHRQTLTMAADAAVPSTWDCRRCGRTARLVDDGDHQTERLESGN